MNVFVRVKGPGLGLLIRKCHNRRALHEPLRVSGGGYPAVTMGKAPGYGARVGGERSHRKDGSILPNENLICDFL